MDSDCEGESDQDDDEREQNPACMVRAEIESWLAPHPEAQRLGMKINYHLAFETNQDVQFAMAQVGVLGAFWFVAHSDCSGGWSAGQAADIARWIRLMEPHMLDTNDTSGTVYAMTVYAMTKTKGYWNKLCSIFEAAAAHGSVVEIC
jgi:hypothetical protein